MKTFISFIAVCMLALFTGSDASDNSGSVLKFQIEQDGKVVKPSKGIISLRRAPFTVVFVLRGNAKPPVKLNLSLNRDNYDGIRGGKKPDTFTVGGNGLAESASPPSDNLFVFGKPVDIEGVHYLVTKRFHTCKKRSENLVCKRTVKKLSVIRYPNGKKSVKTFKPADFPSKPIYISSAIVKKPPYPNLGYEEDAAEWTKNWRKWLQDHIFIGNATVIIQFQ